MKNKEHIPLSLRPMEKEPREERWGIGCFIGGIGVGMKYGPYPTEDEILEEIGEKGDMVFHFLKDSDDVEIVWRWRNDRWIKVKNETSK